VEVWGRMRPDSYRLTAYFDDGARSTASTSFSVH
jgi:hypothetical protein